MNWLSVPSDGVDTHPPKLQHVILADTRQILYMFKPLRAVRQCYYILSNRRCCQRNRTLSKRLSFKGGLYITTPPLSILQVYVLHDYSFWHIFILVNTCRLIFFFFIEYIQALMCREETIQTKKLSTCTFVSCTQVLWAATEPLTLLDF